MSFDSFNEGILVQDAVESYRRRFGYYPESVMTDTIFRNRKNLAYLKLHGIRISGPRLGRPAIFLMKAVRAQERRDTGVRNRIEGTYGTAKRKLGLSRIKAKLESAATTSIVAVSGIEPGKGSGFSWLIFYSCFQGAFWAVNRLLAYQDLP